ncbi:MAG: hypothetical protein KJ604_20680 [Gammaproteobacteria bacterium]|nr:hypothetical protein [Gammaproteobacteria bacterium]
MLATHVTHDQLRTAAAAIGAILVDFQTKNTRGTRVRFRLAPGPTRPYGRLSPNMERADGTPRRIHAVCWHGHREFFRALFLIAPDARVQTTMLGRVSRFNPPNTDPIRWYTAENFERVFPSTGDVNIGSQFRPCLMRDACACVERGHGERAS